MFRCLSCIRIPVGSPWAWFCPLGFEGSTPWGFDHLRVNEKHMFFCIWTGQPPGFFRCGKSCAKVGAPNIRIGVPCYPRPPPTRSDALQKQTPPKNNNKKQATTATHGSGADPSIFWAHGRKPRQRQGGTADHRQEVKPQMSSQVAPRPRTMRRSALFWSKGKPKAPGAQLPPFIRASCFQPALLFFSTAKLLRWRLGAALWSWAISRLEPPTTLAKDCPPDHPSVAFLGLQLVSPLHDRLTASFRATCRGRSGFAHAAASRKRVRERLAGIVNQGSVQAVD